MAEARVPTAIVSGGTASQRERAIADRIAGSSALRHAVLLEGLPDGQPLLVGSPTLLLARTAPGCLCCTGNLVMRVTLNRLLRERPASLLIGVASADHLESLRALLSSPPYSGLLQLETGISC